MKTKVVQYIGRVKDGGAETLLKDYALMLNKECFDVIVLCEDYRKESANYRLLKENNIEIVSTYYPCFFICKILSRIFGGRFRANLLKRKIKKIKPDVIHVHLEELENLSYIIDEIKNTKVIYTCHNVPEIMIGEKRPKEMKAAKTLIEEIGLRIIALHSEMAKEINEMFGIDNTLVIRNGIDFDRFEYSKESRNNKRQELGIPNNSFVIGNIGRFAYQKNHELIVEVFNEILKIKNDTRLILIGEGKLKQEIIERLNKDGNLSKAIILSKRKDVPELLNAMDVFLFPSRFEGISISLIEAQLSELPCIVSNRISPESFLSKKICCLSLDDPVSKWAAQCIKPRYNVEPQLDKDDFNIKTIIKQIEMLYLS